MVVHACDPSFGEQGKLDSVAFKPASLSELLISILGDTPHIKKIRWTEEENTSREPLSPSAYIPAYRHVHMSTYTHVNKLRP